MEGTTSGEPGLYPSGSRRADLSAALRSLASNRLVWTWIAIWIVTRAVMVTQVGFWDHISGVELQDVNSYESWSNYLAEGHMPTDEGWQYPPGAAFLMLLPRIGGAPFGQSFVATMLIFDLVGLALMAALAKRTGRNIGIWVWLLAMPLLRELPILRFDLVPTVFAISALVVIHRRPAWFGALAGIGAAVKVWPIAVLFGEWDRRRLALSAATALGAIVLSFVIAAAAFGGQTTFLDNQGVRGLELESVAASPWYLREAITGEKVPSVGRNGSNEIGSPAADSIAQVLKWVAVLVLVAAALWWLARERAIRGGRLDLKSAETSRDFVFSLVLLLTVVSRVLSVQYMIWLVGLSAVILTAGSRRMGRPAWIVVGAIVISAGLYATPLNLVIRNTALLFAALDAAVGMVLVLRDTGDRLAGDDGEGHGTAPRQPPEPEPGAA
jgi:Glycosyltransferase family 87